MRVNIDIQRLGKGAVRAGKKAVEIGHKQRDGNRIQQVLLNGQAPLSVTPQ